MKVLQLSKYYPPTYGGLEIVAEFFSRAALDLNHEVVVLSLGEVNKKYAGSYKEQVLQSREDIKVKSSPLSYSYLWQFYSQLKNNTPSVIFVHLPNPYAHELLKLFGSMIRAKNIKIVGIYHSDIINQVTLRDAYNLHFKNSLSVYDYFICSSPNLRETSAILSTLERNKVQVIPFCIESLPPLSTLRSPFKGKFLTIGRMVPYKGFEFLIECFKNLPYELTVVGGGPLENKLKKLAGNNVKFLGSVSEKKKFELFEEHDALIVSSINRAEAYGMTIVEAFSQGLPVLASDIDTGVSFLVQENKTGLKFPIKNAEILEQKIKMLSENQNLIQELSQNSLDFFHRELSYPAFLRNVDKFLSSL
ncbi:MAG: glycosyltransferase [Bacteriovoracaceae bacterium]|nr:glycosyltransferase [Bacteriovoracaceae bacterium]